MSVEIITYNSAGLLLKNCSVLTSVKRFFILLLAIIFFVV